tara:strand:+ start:906 stop:1121 length:216 start_codon:yes stop_codon:yes gene_type:complete
MDLNREYAAHQKALIHAGEPAHEDERCAQLAKASCIAGRISGYQHGLGAAAACAWSFGQFSGLLNQSIGTN